MSATNRPKANGDRTVRRDRDYYATPAWCTELVLDRLDGPDRILEPSCGDGAILRVLRERVPSHVELHGVEIDRSRFDMVVGTAVVMLADFLTLDPSSAEPYDLVITNPPFSLASDFVQRSLDWLTPNGVALFLLPLSFLASQRRAPWLAKHCPDVWPLSRRPSFTGGGTDAVDYAWMRWTKHERAKGEVWPLGGGK